MLSDAPLLLVLCADATAASPDLDAFRQNIEQQMAEQGVAASAATLLLAAHAAGLAGCWLSAPLFAPEETRKSLRLPQSWQPQALLILGYPLHNPEKPVRRPLSEVTLWR